MKIDDYPSLIPNPPDILWHYTELRNTLNILENKTLWASDIRFLNDASEISYFRDFIVCDVITKIRRGDEEYRYLDISEEEDEWMLLYHPTRKSFPSAYANNLFRGSVCSASFCEDGDLLSQWRGYSEKTGVALGFSDLSSAELKQSQANIRLIKCCYDYGLAWEVGEKGVIDALNVAREDVRETHEVFNEKFRELLAEFGPIFKNPKFSEELEWRIISSPIEPTDGGLLLRDGGNCLIPYCEIDLSKSFGVRRGRPAVMFGPSEMISMGGYSIDCLSKMIGQDLGCNFSKIPLR